MSRPFPLYFSNRFIVLGFIFRSLTKFELIFVYNMKYEYSFILMPRRHLVSQLNLLKRPSFPSEWPGHPCQKSLDFICKDLFWIYSMGVCMFLYVSITLFSLLYICSKFWNRKCESFNFCSSFSRLAICVPLRFHINIRMYLFL